MNEVIMIIKAPRGEMNLYKIFQDLTTYFLSSRMQEQQLEAIKAFMEQHNGNA